MGRQAGQVMDFQSTRKSRAPDHLSLNSGISKVKIRANFGPLKSKNWAFSGQKIRLLICFGSMVFILNSLVILILYNEK